MDKVREEFEMAWQIKGMDDEGNLGNKPTRSNDPVCERGHGGKGHESPLLSNFQKTAKEMP